MLVQGNKCTKETDVDEEINVGANVINGTEEAQWNQWYIYRTKDGDGEQQIN